MAVRVIVAKTFADKYTGRIYEEGEVLDFKKERAEELLNDSRKLVVKLERKKKGATADGR